MYVAFSFSFSFIDIAIQWSNYCMVQKEVKEKKKI